MTHLDEENVAEQAAADLLSQLQEERVGLWQVPWVVIYVLNGHDYPVEEKDISTPDQVRRISLDVIRRLLRSGIQVGYANQGGMEFRPWSLPPHEAVARVDAEWSAYGPEPEFDHPIWFSSPHLVNA